MSVFERQRERSAVIASDSDVIHMLRDGLQTVLPSRAREFDDLSVDTALADLGIDSLKMMELIALIEDQLARTFHEDDLVRARTIGDLVSLIRSGGRR